MEDLDKKWSCAVCMPLFRSKIVRLLSCHLLLKKKKRKKESTIFFFSTSHFSPSTKPKDLLPLLLPLSSLSLSLSLQPSPLSSPLSLNQTHHHCKHYHDKLFFLLLVGNFDLIEMISSFRKTSTLSSIRAFYTRPLNSVGQKIPST